MTRYRYKDAMNDVVEEREYDDRVEAMAAAVDEDEFEVEIYRVEYLGPEGDWRWAGALEP